MSRMFHFSIVILSTLGLATLFIVVLPAQATPDLDLQTGISVDTLDDEDNSDGDCSLREAIRAANENSKVDACPSGSGGDTDTITFSLSGTITLTEQLSVTTGGPLVVDGGGSIVLSGGDSVRVLYIHAGAEVALNRITISEGVANCREYGCYGDGGGIYNDGDLAVTDSVFAGNRAKFGGGIYSTGNMVIAGSTFTDNHAPTEWEDGGGGAIFSSGALTLTDSSLSENSVSGAGGAIFSTGTLTITGSSLLGNGAGVFGGGIHNDGILLINDSILSDNQASGGRYFEGGGGGIYNGGTMTLTNSIVSENLAVAGESGGGGIFNSGVATLTDSTLVSNAAIFGGAIRNCGSLTLDSSTLSLNSADSWGGGVNNCYGQLNIINSTISDNDAGDRGGAIFTEGGTLEIIAATIYGNSAITGGGIYGWEDAGGQVVLASTILANSTGGNCAGEPVTDSGYNLEDGDTCGLDPAKGSLPDTDPLLGPLQDNGGPTFTQTLLPGSPAIDAGDPDSCPLTDQRGISRPLDGDGDGSAVCDIGAFEWLNLGLYPVKTYLPIAAR